MKLFSNLFSIVETLLKSIASETSLPGDQIFLNLGKKRRCQAAQAVMLGASSSSAILSMVHSVRATVRVQISGH